MMNFENFTLCLVFLFKLVLIFELVRDFKKLPTILKALTFLLSAFFIFQVMGLLVIYIGDVNNVDIYRFALLVYFALTWKVFSEMNKGLRFNKVVSLLFLIGLLAILSIYYFRYGAYESLAEAILVENIVIVFSCLLFYMHMLLRVSNKPLLKQWQFILVTGFFTYSLASSALWITHKIGQNMEVYPDVRYLNTLVYGLEILIFFWAVRIYKIEAKKPMPLNN